MEPIEQIQRDINKTTNRQSDSNSNFLGNNHRVSGGKKHHSVSNWLERIWKRQMASVCDQLQKGIGNLEPNIKMDKTARPQIQKKIESLVVAPAHESGKTWRQTMANIALLQAGSCYGDFPTSETYLAAGSNPPSFFWLEVFRVHTACSRKLVVPVGKKLFKWLRSLVPPETPPWSRSIVFCPPLVVAGSCWPIWDFNSQGGCMEMSWEVACGPISSFSCDLMNRYP